MQTVWVRYRCQGGNPERALPIRKVAEVNWFIDILKGAVATAWYAVLLVAPFWLLRFMLKDMFQ